MGLDKDLSSIQEARDLVTQAYQAWQAWKSASQVEVDRVCAAMAEAGYAASERLGRLAQEETGYGVAAHKKLKNEFGSRGVWESIRDLKTVGVLRQDESRRLYEIAWPMGVVLALVPSTNPTSTAFFKMLISVKARNAIVISPHPAAVKCTLAAVQTMAQAAESVGAPRGLVSCMQQVSMPGTQELMNHRRVAVILATGGTPMVRAAHSTGKPAYGVGPGNVPVYVDRSADIEKAARYIVASKAFDHSTICATEQTVIADRPIAQRLAQLMQAEGAYFTSNHKRLPSAQPSSTRMADRLRGRGGFRAHVHRHRDAAAGRTWRHRAAAGPEDGVGAAVRRPADRAPAGASSPSWRRRRPTPPQVRAGCRSAWAWPPWWGWWRWGCGR